MKETEQTLQQLERVIRKVAEKFPATKEATQLTDLHLRVGQDTGEVRVYDDDDCEITRCVVAQWIDNKDDDFYDAVTAILRKTLKKHKQLAEGLSLLKPYAFVLEDDEREPIAELYVADDDTVIIDSDLMQNLGKDLDDFFENLMQKEN